MSTFAQRLIALERSQLGVHESPSNSNLQKFGSWYGMNGQPWCFMFQSWAFSYVGCPLPNMGSSKGGHYTPTGVNYAKSHGLWSASGHYAPGDMVFFTWGSRGGLAEHVALVVADNGSTISTLEGNVGGYGGEVEAR